MSLIEASQSGILKEISNYFSNPFITGTLGTIGGFFLALVKKVWDGWVNEIYEHRKEARAKRQEAAKDVTSFCMEGMHTDFRWKAGSEHHIKFRAKEIETINLDVGIKLREFLNNWSMYRTSIKGQEVGTKDGKESVKYKKKAQKLGDELLEIAKEWAK